MRLVEDLWRAPCQLKKGSETETKELLGGSESELCFPNEGSLIRSPGKARIFFYLSAPLKFGCLPLEIAKIPMQCVLPKKPASLFTPLSRIKTFSSMSVADGVSLHDIIASILVFPCWKLWLKTMASDKLLNSANFFSGGLPSCFGIVSTKIDQAD